MKNKYLLLTLPFLAFANNAWADETGGIDVGVKLSTLGAGVEVNYPLSSRWTVAVGLNKYSKSQIENIDGNDYDQDIDLQTLSLLFNYHPFKGTFRVTAGAMLNNNEVKLTADPNATYEINGTVYDSSEFGELKASVDFEQIAPYIGVGFGHGASSGFSFTFDVGVLMQGEPNVDMTSTGGSLSNDPTFQANLKQEEANAQDDIDEFTLYPVVALGLSYRF
jgi:hypothetical protein